MLATPAFHAYVYACACVCMSLQPPRLYTVYVFVCKYVSQYIVHKRFIQTYANIYVHSQHIHTHSHASSRGCECVVYLGVYVFVHICRGCAADAIAMPLTQPLGSAHCLVVSSRGVVSENINGCGCGCS